MMARYGASEPHVARDYEFGSDDPARASVIGGTAASRTMTVEDARAVLSVGKRLRIVIGPGADDPTIVLSLDEGMVMCESVAGWSAGVVEPACALSSDYLATYLDKPVETLEPGESGWRVI